MYGPVLLNLADIANCVSGDFHVMHLNYKGQEFDNMHKKVLQKYYEQAADDYDSWAEAAAMYEVVIPNPNNSAQRVEWQSCEGSCNRNSVVERTDFILGEYLMSMQILFNKINQENDFKSIGVCNTLQTRIEYWNKEKEFFNKRRGD